MFGIGLIYHYKFTLSYGPLFAFVRISFYRKKFQSLPVPPNKLITDQCCSVCPKIMKKDTSGNFSEVQAFFSGVHAILNEWFRQFLKFYKKLSAPPLKMPQSQ